MSEKHSMLSPSKAGRYMRCPVSAVRAVGVAEDVSEFAEEGRLAHALAESILTGKPEPAGVPADMREPVSVYVETVKAMSQGASATGVEKRVDLASVLDEGEKGAVDFYAIVGGELQVHDLKYGKGVKVDAEDNEQLLLYGLGMLPAAELLADIAKVRLVIHQPRLGNVSEVVYTVQEMNVFRDKFRAAVEIISGLKADDPANPGEKQCRFCPKGVKQNCKELAEACINGVTALGETAADVKKSVSAVDMEALAKSYAMLPLIGIFVKAVEEAAMSRLLAGESMPGFKLVEGRAGNRQWADDEQAEKWMKKLKLKVDEMYTKKIISPSAAEKLLKDNPRHWEKLQPLVTRTPPKPAIAPESDSRPAIQTASELEFEDVTAGEKR